MPRRTSSAKAEQKAIEADETLQEQGPPPTITPARIATDYVHAKHPDTGLDVVFVRGEALPDWAGHKPEVDKAEVAE